MKNCNVMIVGVGGQGTLLASRVLGRLAIVCGKDVKLSEVHGMAQRGGSVVTFVRISDKVFSPVVSEGDADFVLAFEKLEALRYAHYLKHDGTLIVNNEEISPMPVIIGKESYPKNIIADIEAKGYNVKLIEALKIANECGNSKATNTVMLGTLARMLEVSKEQFLDVLKETVPQKFLELNLTAGEKGYDL